MNVGARVSKAVEGLGSLVHGNNAARAHVLANRAKYGIASKGTRTVTKGPGAAAKLARRKSSGVAHSAMNAAIAKRQTQVGRRVIGGAVGLGGIGYMGRNRDGSRGGFRGPRGTGRYA
jgi:hypothetical protein